MGALLDRDALPLASTFRRQRESLEDKRRLLDRGIEALAEAERAPRRRRGAGRVHSAESDQDHRDAGIDVMRKYFSDEAWAEGREHFDDWPSPDWQALYRDVAAALDADPAGPAAQALADRWLALALARVGAGMRTGLHRAWADREHWPPVLKRKIAEFNIEQATRFINEVLWIRWDAEREAVARTTTSAPPRVGEHRRALYRDCAAILGESPAGPSAQAVLARWRAIVEEEAGGDDQTRAGMLKAFRGRATWPAGLKRYWASLYDMDAETWERVADFIERANDVTGPRITPSGPRSPSGSSARPPTASSAHPR